MSCPPGSWPRADLLVCHNKPSAFAAKGLLGGSKPKTDRAAVTEVSQANTMLSSLLTYPPFPPRPPQLLRSGYFSLVTAMNLDGMGSRKPNGPTSNCEREMTMGARVS